MERLWAVLMSYVGIEKEPLPIFVVTSSNRDSVREYDAR